MKVFADRLVANNNYRLMYFILLESVTIASTYIKRMLFQLYNSLAGGI